MYDEDDLLPLSALQHLVFCERQCALIHVEQVWKENVLTVEGHFLHERAHQAGGLNRGDIRVAYGVRLRSLRLGLVGMADVVEFALSSDGSKATPFPVEYKHGKPKPDRCDEVQLCAQGLCLEEMLGVPVPAGALFYGKTRRRLEVPFDEPLRSLTAEKAARLHELVGGATTPPPVYGKKCENCSLAEACQPRVLTRKPSIKSYMDSLGKTTGSE